MKKIKYTPDAADKLRDMKSTITTQYGSKKAKKIVGEITKAIRGLEEKLIIGENNKNKYVRHCLAKVVPQIERNFRFVACFYSL